MDSISCDECESFDKVPVRVQRYFLQFSEIVVLKVLRVSEDDEIDNSQMEIETVISLKGMEGD